MNEVDGSNQIVVSGTSSEISFQVYQDVYNSITGRKENLSKNFFGKHQVSLDDLKVLHARTGQTLEQYACEGSACSVIIRYSDGRTDTYSSFDDHFSDEMILDGTNIHFQIGFDLFTAKEFENFIPKHLAPAVEAAAAEADHQVIALAVLASLVYPDRIPWLLR